MTDPAHGFTQDQLLAYVHKTAPGDLAAKIDAAQADDRALAAEIALMQGLKPALEQASGGLNPPGELDWRRLEGDIRRERRAAPAPVVDSGRGGRIVMWKVAAMFFAMATLGQATYLALSPGAEPDGFQISMGERAQHMLAIRFAPGATEEQMRTLLRSVDARIIDGPRASGLYGVGFMSAEAKESGQAALQSAPIVELVAE